MHIHFVMSAVRTLYIILSTEFYTYTEKKLVDMMYMKYISKVVKCERKKLKTGIRKRKVSRKKVKKVC